MQRYFIEKKDQEYWYLQDDDIHHCKKVMRSNQGDHVIAIDQNQNIVEAKITNLDIGQLQVIKAIDENNECDLKITLIYAMPKGDKFEFVLQKATELGVHKIIPIQTKRCVVKLDQQKFQKKKQRFNKILKEASEQSYRNQIPHLEQLQTIQTLHPFLSENSLVAYEETAKEGCSKNFISTLKQLQPNDEITIIVGSEGGFEESEIEQLEQYGVKRCSLGKRILRSETAPLYMLSVITFMREEI